MAHALSSLSPQPDVKASSLESEMASPPFYSATPSPSTPALLDPDSVSSIDFEHHEFRNLSPSSSPPQQIIDAPHSNFGRKQTQKHDCKQQRQHEEILVQVLAHKEAAPSPAVCQAIDLVWRHHRGKLGSLPRATESVDLPMSPNEYEQLRNLLDGQKLLVHFDSCLRHDYISRRNCLTLRLMAEAAHENIKAKVKREIERGLDEIRREAQQELHRLQQQITNQEAQAKEIIALQAIIRLISEIDPDFEHAYVKFGSKKHDQRSPDIQFRHKNRHPQFVGEIGWSQSTKSLKRAATDYVELSDQIQTILILDISYNGKKAREQDKCHGNSQSNKREEAQLNRSASVWLFRDARQVTKAKFRDEEGRCVGQGDDVTLYLSDFISPPTLKAVERLLPTTQQLSWHPTALTLVIPFAKLSEICSIAEQGQTESDRTPPHVQFKRKIVFIEDEEG